MQPKIITIVGGSGSGKSMLSEVLMKVNIIFPRKLSRKAREAIEKLKEEGM